ncbi:hypothetical protein OY671_009676, partial [Metschnikowia pulcherrima]
REQDDQRDDDDWTPKDFRGGHDGVSFRLETEAALAAEAPIDAAVSTRDAGDMAAKSLFDRGGPGHELEAQAVVDHGEAARTEREAPAVGAGDKFTGGGLGEGAARLSREFFAERLDLAMAQRVDQLASENDASASPLGESFADQAFGAALHRRPHLRAESSLAECCGFARDGLPVEPGGA